MKRRYYLIDGKGEHTRLLISQSPDGAQHFADRANERGDTPPYTVLVTVEIPLAEYEGLLNGR